MKLLAISDLHVGYAANLEALQRITPRPDDWLILAGDLGETVEQVRYVITTLAPRFGQLLWVPGNHELWTVPRDSGLRGEAEYQEMVTLCRAHGVLTPEDPYATFDDGQQRYLIAAVREFRASKGL